MKGFLQQMARGFTVIVGVLRKVFLACGEVRSGRFLTVGCEGEGVGSCVGVSMLGTMLEATSNSI